LYNANNRWKKGRSNIAHLINSFLFVIFKLLLVLCTFYCCKRYKGL